jgi:ABC-type sugar transport system permease subunit
MTGTMVPRRVIGALLVMPALVLLIFSYVLPTVRTVRLSFVEYHGRGQPDTPVGGRNYSAAAHAGLGHAIGNALSLATVPLLVVVVLAPLLALAAHVAGTATRWTVRTVLAIPMAAFAPAAMAISWVLDHPAGHPPDPQRAFALATFGLVSAVAVTTYLATLRRRDPGRPTWPATVLVTAVLVLVTLAGAVQQQTFSIVSVFGDPRQNSPLSLSYRLAAEQFHVGSAAAVSTVLLGILAVLGLGVAALVIVARLRIEVDPGMRPVDERPGWPPQRVLATAATGVLLLLVVVVMVIGLWPWLHRLGDTTLPPEEQFAKLAVNTWLPPMVSAGVAVLVAVLAGVGIGALRPLGRFSELLLLPFAPWLLVGSGPLLWGRYIDGGDARFGTPLGLIQPVWVAVPALFVTTLLLRGQVSRWRERPGQDVVRSLLLPVAPMVVLLVGVTWLLQTQDLWWQEIAGSSADHRATTFPVRGYESYFAAGLRPGLPPVGVILPLVLLIPLFLAAVAAQLGYLDRVAVRTGPATE